MPKRWHHGSVPDLKRPSTMADVARVAGVSVPTVSRVLSGSANVSAKRRERVAAAIAELSFRPSAAARVLASRRPEVISIVAGDTSKYGYAETIRGIEEAARASGYTVMITVVETTDGPEIDAALASTLSQPIAGVIVLKFDPPGVAALRRIPDDIPVVALSGVREAGVHQAVIDETRAGEELTNYLLELGHETVHHVRVPPSRREDGRTTGWRRALKKAGREIPAPLDASWDPASGREIGRMLAADPMVTAVFCGNDEIAMGVIRGISDVGLGVPRDISVAGFDNHPLSAMWTPEITTAHQDFAGLGGRGFQLLVGQLRGESGSRFSSARPPIIVRESATVPSLSRGAAAAAAPPESEAI